MEADEKEELPPLTDTQTVAPYLLVIWSYDWREVMRTLRTVEYSTKEKIKTSLSDRRKSESPYQFR